MPTVDDNRLTGNAGAALVAAKLSGACLVRPVAADTDVGVDLYCETLEESQPFLHFWVQVKSGGQCRVSDDGASASCSFSRAHLEYWARQPVPVFGALVPLNPDSPQNTPVYIVDISDQLLELKRDSGAKSYALTSRHVWRPDNPEDVRLFLERAVPAGTARLACRNGVVTTIPSLQRRYTREVPTVPVLRFGEVILRQLRVTAAMAIISLRCDGQLQGQAADFRRRLARVVAQFDGDGHWETYAAQAFSSHADHEYPQAIELYDKAIKTIRTDPNVCDLPDWIQRVAQLVRDRELATLQQDLEWPDILYSV